MALNTTLENKKKAIVFICKNFAILITGNGGYTQIFVIFSIFAQTLRAFNSFVNKITYKRPFSSKLQASKNYILKPIASYRLHIA